MKGKTHAITGALITTAILRPSTASDIGIVLATGAIGALIPDIDISTSKITHYITNTKINSPLIQTIIKIVVLNIFSNEKNRSYFTFYSIHQCISFCCTTLNGIH